MEGVGAQCQPKEVQDDRIGPLLLQCDRRKFPVGSMASPPLQVALANDFAGPVQPTSQTLPTLDLDYTTNLNRASAPMFEVWLASQSLVLQKLWSIFQVSH